jgi:hypothetical protein
MNHQYLQCSEVLGRFTRAIVIIQYMVGTWIILCRIWNSPKALEWFHQRIQQRLVHFTPQEEKRLDKESTEECQDPIDEKIESNPEHSSSYVFPRI